MSSDPSRTPEEVEFLRQNEPLRRSSLLNMRIGLWLLGLAIVVLFIVSFMSSDGGGTIRMEGSDWIWPGLIFGAAVVFLIIQWAQFRVYLNRGDKHIREHPKRD